jgi:iron complex outermembrane recepter protein
MSSRLTYAIACILAGASGSAAAAATPGSDSSTSTSTQSLEEVVVTAQRRTENIQDVPISIQALTAQTLQQLNISTFDDYITFLPNVTSASNGPGQNDVFMRGLSAGSQASQASAITGVLPNVAI